MSDNNDIFYLDKVYPNPEKIFSFDHKNLKNILNEAIIILDTNVLLVPFSTSKDDLDDIKKIFLKLKGEGRLFIPERVAREFAKNRSTKIGELSLQISQKKESLNKFDPSFKDYPLLKSNKSFLKVKEKFKEIKKEIDNIRDLLANIENDIMSWNWGDEVSRAYKEVFTEDIIIGVEKNLVEIEKDLAFRNKYKIAPGFNDSTKDDKGIGDLLIWQTILEIGKNKGKDIIFVSNDKKNDWYTVQNKKPLFPKFELFDEFRRFSNGKSFQLILFSDFLKTQDAKEQTIKSIKSHSQKEIIDPSGVADLYLRGTIVSNDKFGIGIVVGGTLNAKKEQGIEVRFKTYKTVVFYGKSINSLVIRLDLLQDVYKMDLLTDYGIDKTLDAIR